MFISPTEDYGEAQSYNLSLYDNPQKQHEKFHSVCAPESIIDMSVGVY